jgi:type IV pilus assembly protein PilC
MPTFVWEAKNRTGDIKTGEMDAANPDAVMQRLKQQNLQPTKVKKKTKPFELKMPGATGVTVKDLVIFTRQFATMIDAGLPLVQCLEILGTQGENPAFKKVIMDVKSVVESGKTLAEALGKHPKIFNSLFVNLVAAGESGGVLDVIMNRLAQYIEKNQKLMKQVKGAMVYPIIVLTVSGAVTLVLLVFVIPIFQKMFADFGSALPAPTQMVVDVSEFTRGNIVYILAVVGAFIAGMSSILKSKRGREIFDFILINAPVFGPMIQKKVYSYHGNHALERCEYSRCFGHRCWNGGQHGCGVRFAKSPR